MITHTSETMTFAHGVHPHEFKEMTQGLALERIPFMPQYILPTSQHTGGPSRPVVQPGQRVKRGQVIAEPTGFVSCYLHAPVTGIVKSISLCEHPSGQTRPAIVIDTDPHSLQVLEAEIPDWQNMASAQLIDKIRWGGFVGMGGAAFPSHVKLKVPDGKKAKFLIVNGCECEPFLTCDHRIMLENYSAMLLGIRICLKILGAERAYVGIENNKPDAIEILRQSIPQDLSCAVIPLHVKYPQGAEKMLITAVLGREVPSGKLPIDAQTIVHNVGTLAAIGDLFQYGQPMIERPVTVTGPGIRRPGNYLIPIGTKLSDVIAHCGGILPETRHILFGGPMMGTAQRMMDVPILKGTSGILCLTTQEMRSYEELSCIRCGRCMNACPVFLNPSRLGLLARKKLYDTMMQYHLMDCIECGCCSYICPSSIPLVQRFRVAKAMIREKQARDREKQEREQKAKEQEAQERKKS